MRKINKKKLVHELIAIAVTIFGVAIFVLNITKTCNPESVVAPLIAYGFVVGPVFAALGVSAFFEIRDTKYPRKRAR